MAVPLIPGLSVATSKLDAVDSPAVAGSDSNGRGFSEHFDKKMDQLAEKRQAEPAAKAKGNAAKQAVDDKSAVEQGVQFNPNQHSVKPESGQVSANVLPAELLAETLAEEATGELMAVDNFIDGAVGLPGVAAVAAESGNLFPPEVVDDFLTTEDDLVAAEGVNYEAGGDIVFDPLAQTNELLPYRLESSSVEQKTLFDISNDRSAAFSAGVDSRQQNLAQKAGVVKINKPSPASAEVVLPAEVLMKGTIGQVQAAEGLLKGASAQMPEPEGLLKGPLAQTQLAAMQQTTERMVAGAPAQTVGATPQALVDRATISLDTPVGHSRWGQDFNQRVQWAVNQSVSGAQIRINPQHMGPVEVKIQLQNEQLSISFTAQHGATREAIDAALPRLREMLSEQNVNLVDVDVSQHSFAEQGEKQASTTDDKLGRLSEAEQEESLFDESEAASRRYEGLFSDFA
ncbi:MAG: flagellar hook-length control protein FliK [Cycloclasticus sp.]